MQAARGTSLNDAASPGGSGAPARLTHLFAFVAVIGYVLDVVTKRWAVAALTERDIEVVGQWLVLHLVRNPGAAFSTGERFTVALTLVAITATCVVLYFGWRVRSPLWAVSLGLLLAGVLGNLTDRLFRDPAPFRGHVVDFLQVPNWPVFNVADICINLAAGLILIQAFRGVRVDGTRDAAQRVSP